MSNDAKKIDRAIRACIRECFGSSDISAKIAKFLDDLRRDPEWISSELLLVESSVCQLLNRTLVEERLGSNRAERYRKAA